MAPIIFISILNDILFKAIFNQKPSKKNLFFFYLCFLKVSKRGYSFIFFSSLFFLLSGNRLIKKKQLMSGQSWVNEGENSTISLKLLLESTLEYSEKDLRYSTSGKLKLSSKRMVMHSLLRTKIRIARYLAIFRWSQTSSVSKTIQSLKTTFEENTQKVSESYLSYRHVKRAPKTNQNNVSLWNSEIFKPISIFSPLKTTLIVLFQGIMPLDISNVFFMKREIIVQSNDFYSYSFSISKNTSLKLRSYSIFFPIKENYLNKISTALSTKFSKYNLDKFFSFFQDIHDFFQDIRTTFWFTHIISLLSMKQRKYGFRILRGDKKCFLAFGCQTLNFDDTPYSILFSLIPTICGVSCISLQKLHEKADSQIIPTFYKTIINVGNIDNVLNQMRERVISSFLLIMQNRIINAFIIGGFPSFTCDITEHSLYVSILNKPFSHIYFSKETTEPCFELFGSYEKLKNDFMNVIISADENEQITFSHKLYLEAISNDLLSFAVSHVNEYFGASAIFSNSIMTHYIKYSFAPDYSIRLLNTSQTPYVDIVNDKFTSITLCQKDPQNHDFENDSIYQTNEMVLLADNSHRTVQSDLRNAVYSAKSQLILLQMKKYLDDDNIQSKIVFSNSRISFQLTHDTNIFFKIDAREKWTLKFSKRVVLGSPVRIVISGRHLTANFCRSIFHLCWILDKTTTALQQIKHVHRSTKIIQLDIMSNIQFSFSLYSKQELKTLIEIEPLTFESKKDQTCYYTIPHFVRQPDIKQVQPLRTPFGTLSLEYLHMNDSSYNKLILLYGSNLSMIYAIFSHDQSWSIQHPYEYSIHLIYRKKFTLNLRIRDYINQLLELPLNAAHQPMSIPLRFLGKPQKSSTSYRFNFYIRNSTVLKRAIEEFFICRDILFLLHFKDETFTTINDDIPILSYSKKSFPDLLDVTVSLSYKGIDPKYQGKIEYKLRNLLQYAKSPPQQRGAFCLIVGSCSCSKDIALKVLDDVPKLFSDVSEIETDKTLATTRLTKPPDPKGFGSNNYIVQMTIFMKERKIQLAVLLDHDHNRLQLMALENKTKLKDVNNFSELINYLNPQPPPIRQDDDDLAMYDIFD